MNLQRLLWPLRKIWNPVCLLAAWLGRALSVLVGTALVLMGCLLCPAGIGYLAGIPLALFGALLILRGVS